MKANPALTLHEQMLIFITTRQGQSESDDDYLNKFNSILENIILAGGGHIMCIPQILGKDMASCTTVEIDAQKERFKAMCFILRADENRYGDLLEELRKGVTVHMHLTRCSGIRPYLCTLPSLTLLTDRHSGFRLPSK